MMRKLILISLSVFLLAVLSGCDNGIVEKLAKGQTLSAEEMKEYVKSPESKKNLDERAAELKKEIEENKYHPPSTEQIKLGVREYKPAGGKDINISPSVCKALGFLAGSRVKTPDGDAYFVGVDKDGDGWFHIDGERSAKCYNRYKSEDYVKKGFKLLSPPDEVRSVAAHAEEKPAEQTAPIKEESQKEQPLQKPVAKNSQKPAPTAVAPMQAIVETHEFHPGEMEKLTMIPPIPPLKEK